MGIKKEANFMAGNSYTVNFDEGIEKVEYSDSLHTFPSGEITSSGQTISGYVEFYMRPIFKQGYELDTTNVSLSDSSPDIYTAQDVNKKSVLNINFTSKQSGGGVAL